MNAIRHAIVIGGVLLTLLLAGSPAAAGPGSENIAQARIYFKAGAQAYEKGQFLASVQAFEKAHELAPRDGLLFSIAQAYRRQYYLDKHPQRLRLAIDFYEKYAAKVKTGGRAADTAEALAELQPIAQRLGAAPEEGVEPPPPPPPPPEQKTRLMVSSPTEGAQIAVDGTAPQELPLITEVKPGPHQILLSAPGYFEETRDVQAAKGGVVALDIALREQPAQLSLTTEDGAAVSVDGRFVGDAPLGGPLELSAGAYLVTVALNGREGYVEELELTRGEERQVDVALEETSQRIASYVMLAVGGAALAAGGAFVGVAVSQEGDAEDLQATAEQQNIDRDQLYDYNAAIERRDDWRLAAGITLGSGALLGLTGLLMLAIDEPDVRVPARRVRPDGKPSEDAPAKPADTDSMEVAAGPIGVPGGAGAGMMLRW